MSKIVIYSKPDCPWCTKAKVYFAKHNLVYTEFMLGSDITREEIIEQFPQMKTMPIILIDDKLVGGYTQMVERFGGEHKHVS